MKVCLDLSPQSRPRSGSNSADGLKSEFSQASHNQSKNTHPAFQFIDFQSVASSDNLTDLGMPGLTSARFSIFARRSPAFGAFGCDSFSHKDPDFGFIGSDVRRTLTIHAAADGGETEAVRLLIEQGCDVNDRDADGNTALHFAARKGHRHVCEMLVQAGECRQARPASLP